MGSNEQVGLFPIRTVSRITGVNPMTLRSWERRYALVKPHRSGSGRRLYSRAQIDLISRVANLLASGMPISQACTLLKQQAKQERGPASAEVWASYQARTVAAVTSFDERALEDVYDEALGAHARDLVFRRLIVPVLVELGHRWEKRTGTVAEEHFFSTYLRNKLGALFHHRRQRALGLPVLFACVPGEQHEFGLLLAALAAQEAGLRPILLGANTPLAGLQSPAQRANCTAIVLSGSAPLLPPLADALANLARAVRIPVYVGGALSVLSADRVSRCGAIAVGTDIDFLVERLLERRPALPHA